MDRPVTYGIVLANNSRKLEKCFRRFVSHNPHTMYEVIATTLAPLTNSWSNVFRKTLESAMVEEVMYEDSVFKCVLYFMLAVLLVVLCAGKCN